MKLLADRTGEQFLEILERAEDKVTVQFISNEGEHKGKPFNDSLSGLLLAGWTHRTTSTAIGLSRFKRGYLEDPHVSFALHQLFPLGRKVKLPCGDVMRIASYANTHCDGYYMYLKDESNIMTRLKITPDWELLPLEDLLALPYYPAPRSQAEMDTIDEFDRWAGGF
ncbi:hypothetical protein GT360_06225 [Vibrio astriarenae]|uniref:Uncharacterized protein n=1 Tax=Vibrio astriarenae TaxID=1481923 RepID=A0A7Z2T2L7_9VIBR|nr:hypothetical protein [Vibrio astriarenae]QIA63131.1 hypothetical protein GT360_06225 [Vibrio astriarenae]